MATKTAFSPKYKLIYEQLRSSILSGNYGLGDRLPTEAELVERFGASRTTVIRALRELEHTGLLSRRQGSGSYATPKTPAQRQLFGFVMPMLSPEERAVSIFSSLYDEMSSLSHDRGAAMLFGSRTDAADESGSRVLSVVDQMLAHKATGVFYVPQGLSSPYSELNHKVVRMLSDKGVPLVLLDRDIFDFPRRSKFDLISIDNQSGAYQVAAHLVSVGCKKIVFVSDSAASTVTSRRSAVHLALEDAGVPIGEDWLVTDEDRTPEGFERFINRVQPDGLLCSYDGLAAICMRNLLAMGVRVPQDIKISGFDDSAVAALLPVPLTTIRQPVKSLATFAVRAMFERIAEPSLPTRHVLASGDLIIRESTANVS